MKKLLAPVAAVGLLLAMVTTALAWSWPVLTSKCAPDANSYAWKVTLPTEPDYTVDWSFDFDFASFTTTDFAAAGDHEFTTLRGGPRLYVRFVGDPTKQAVADANPDLCVQAAQSASQSAEQSVEAATGTPSGSIPNTSLDGGGPNPLPTILFSLVLLASLGTLAYTNVKVVTRRNR